MTTTISPLDQVYPGAEPLLDDAVGQRDATALGRPGALLASLGTTAQRLFAEATLDDTVSAVTRLAGQMYGSPDVGVLLRGVGGEPEFVSGVRETLAARADALQVCHRQGPALQGIERRQPVIVTDLRFDSRWRFWAPLAADLGFRSALTVPLADGDMVGALTVYSSRVSRFPSADLASAIAFAQLTSIAIAVAQEREQLIRAATSRAVVGQAQGILMERYGVTSDQAFTVLRRYSSHLNQKLRTIAEGVSRDRRLPDTEAAESGPVLLPLGA